MEATRRTTFTPTQKGLVFELSHGDTSAESQVAEQAISLGYVETLGDGELLLPWRHVYDLLDDDELGEDRGSLMTLLGLPAREHGFAPLLVQNGSLDDKFGISVDGWTRPGQGLKEHGWKQLKTGPLIEFGGHLGLLPAKTWRLLESILEWNNVPLEERTGERARRAWARIRQQAIEAGAGLSEYLRTTVVITADTLKISYTEGSSPDFVQVTPEIDGAPVEWLEKLDKSSRIRPIYRTSLDGRDYEIVIEDDVKSVLSHLLEHTSGRRFVHGKKAQRILTNPFEVLGDRARNVLDEGQVSEAVAAFDSKYHPFEFGGNPRVDEFPFLLIHPLPSQEEENPSLHQFGSVTEYEEFMRRLVAAVQKGTRAIPGPSGKPLLLDELAESRIAIALLRYPVEGLQAPDEDLGEAGPAMIAAADLLNPEAYAKRVKAIDVLLPFGVMRVPNATKVDWFGELGGEPEKEEAAGDEFGEEPVITLEINAPGGDGEESVNVELDVAAVRDLEQILEDHGAVGDSITLPGTDQQVPVEQASDIISRLRQASRGEGSQPTPKVRYGLVEETNVEVVSYQRHRADDETLRSVGEADLPESLAPGVSLLPHQKEGLAWLQNLWKLSAEGKCAGALLADDMGVGKTLQTLSLIVRAREIDPDSPPALVVAPVSLLKNWATEIERFFKPGSVRHLILDSSYGSRWRVPKEALPAEAREKGITNLLLDGWRSDAQVVITNYETLRNFQFSICREPWSIVVFDEAQKIKNPEAISTRAAKVVKARFRVVCTGTPVENSLTDLWCLFDTAVQPGLLGAANEFARSFERPIQRGNPEGRRELINELRRRINPQVLRRLKEDISDELPEKRFDTACRNIAMTPKQHEAYLNLLAAHKEGRAGSALQVLPQLNKICSDFSVLSDEERHRETAEQLASCNAKFAWLLDTLDRIREKQEKALIFANLRNVQRHLSRHIRERYGIHVDIINGETPVGSRQGDDRQSMIDDFSRRPGFQVLILSPIAGGVGLNIQAANHVIHYLRHWNPAKEDQATDRAYRIGQNKPVTVYTPIVRGKGFRSFDEGLDELLEAKRSLAKDMLEVRPEVTQEELAARVVGGVRD